jgi:hypothetical protein
MSLTSPAHPLQDTIRNKPAPIDAAAIETPRHWHYCRNPRCRTKLPAPVSNAHEAFCSPGCHVHFFRTRCPVCEGPIEQPARGTRLTCNKIKCRRAWRAGFGFGRYHTLNHAKSIQRKARK